MSAVKQPVDFLMQEGGMTRISKQYTKKLTPPIFYTDEFALRMFAPDKNDSIGNLSTLSKEQTKTLECALKFDQAQHVIYFVRSDKLQETENIVSAVAPQNTDSNESKLFEACGPALTGIVQFINNQLLVMWCVMLFKPFPHLVLDTPGYCFIFKHVVSW